MNTVTQIDTAGSTPVAPYAVDTSAGAMRGDVAAQWAARPHDQRYATLRDLYDFKRGVWDRSMEARIASPEFTVVSPSLDFDTTGMESADKIAEGKRRMGQLFLQADIKTGGDRQNIVEVAPTNWAFSQLAKLADFRGSDLKKLPTSIVADIVNWQLRYNTAAQGTKAWLTPEELMAINSPTYGRIADHDVVSAIMTIAGDGTGTDPRFHWKTPGKLNWANGTYDPENIGPKDDRTFYGSDRDMFCFLVDDRRPIEVGKTRDGKPDLMFRGFYVQNSQVGSRSLKVASFYLRGVCMNRNLWGVEKFQEIMIRHTSGAPERWLQEARPALESFANRSDATLIEGVTRAKAVALVDKDEDAFAFLKTRGFNERASLDIIKVSEDEEGKKPRSIWDFGQAITAYARSAPNSDIRLEHELKAKLLFDKVS